MPAFAIQRDAATAEFLDGTKRGEFLIVKDTRTGEMLSPQFDVSADPQRYVRVPAAGTGTVVSWSVVHQRGGGRLPVGIVELDEGRHVVVDVVPGCRRGRRSVRGAGHGRLRGAGRR